MPANSAVVQNKLFFKFSLSSNFPISYLDKHNLRTVAHFLRDQGTDINNKLDSVAQSLK